MKNKKKGGGKGSRWSDVGRAVMPLSIGSAATVPQHFLTTVGYLKALHLTPPTDLSHHEAF